MGIVLVLLSYVFAAFLVLVAATYFYLSRRNDHWQRKGIPFLTPRPFVGNIGDVLLLRKSIGQLSKAIYDEHKGRGFVGYFVLDQPVLQINDLNLISHVLVTDFNSFSDRSSTQNERIDPLPARSILFLKGERWREARVALTPSFAPGKVKKMYDLIVKCARGLGEFLDKETASGESIDVNESAARYTTDCIAACCFGIRGNALRDPDAEFRNKMRLVFQFSAVDAIKFALLFFAPNVLEFLQVKVLKPEVDTFVRETLSAAIAYREKNATKRGDFLDSLIELKNRGRIDGEDDTESPEKKEKYVIEDLDIMAHSLLFLIAGFETSALTIAFALYELAMHSDVQDRLRREIRNIMGQREELTYEEVNEFNYLDMVIKETLRMYPTLPFIDREATEDYTLPGTNITLEKGTRIVVPVYGLHMDPELFPCPESFDPERFSQENRRKIARSSYMPFGIGPRSCVGKLFGVTQVKLALVRVLQEYTVHPCTNTPKEMQFNTKSFSLQPKQNIPLIFRKI